MPIASVNTHRLRGWLLRLLLLAIALCAAPPLQAQDCRGSSRKGDGADVQCHIDKILAKHEALIGTMKGKLGSCVGANCGMLQKHLEKVESGQKRAKEQHGRMQADDYEKVNSRKKAKCKGPNCYETPGDFEISDDLETGTGAELVDQLNEIGEGLDKTNALLSEPVASPTALRSLTASAATVPVYDYTKDPDYPAWLHIADNPKALIPAAFGVTVAATVAEGVRRVTKNICQQDILGFNASLACIVTATIAAALDSTAVLLNFNLADATAWDTHGAYLRAANLNDTLITVDGNVSGVGAQVGAAQTALVALGGRFLQLQEELLAMNQRLIVFQNQIIQLLLTPEGQRAVPSSILTCDGSTTACPAVALSCSPTTGLCSFK